MTHLPPLALMALAMVLVPLGDSAGKGLVSLYGVAPATVAFSHFALGALALAPFLNRSERRPAALFAVPLVLRGLALGLTLLLLLAALRTTPVATVYGAFFLGPAVSTVLATLFLGERLTARRAAFTALGFAGVLLVTRPSLAMPPGTGLALLAGLLYGVFLTASRWLAADRPPRTLLFSQLVVASLLLAPLALPALPAPTAPIAGLALAHAMLAMAGNLLLILAYARAEATRLAPAVYLQLVAAAAFGALFFGEIPDLPALAGLALIAASGVLGARTRG